MSILKLLGNKKIDKNINSLFYKTMNRIQLYRRQDARLCSIKIRSPKYRNRSIKYQVLYESLETANDSTSRIAGAGEQVVYKHITT